MTISVVICVYNGGRRLKDAVESVLAQSRCPDEFLLVDDGSTDGAAKAVASLYPQIRYVRRPNGGLAAARNLALRQLRGDLVTFLDADDLWPGRAVEANLRALGVDRTTMMALGMTQIFKLGEAGEFVPTEYQRHILCLGAGLFRREVFDRAGCFDESMRLGSDVDWLMRAKHAGFEPTRHPELTYLYRRHDRSITGDLAARNKAFATAVHRALLRKRDAEGSLKP